MVILFCATTCFGQELISEVTDPQEVSSEVRGYANAPKEIQGLQWHRWTSKNFTVCAINNNQAQYLHKHLELVKGWVFSRWGLTDIDFSKECKIICVDDPILYKKLFGIDDTKVEIRRDVDGVIKESVIFMLFDSQTPSEIMPTPLTKVCMAELAQKYDTKISFCCTQGMAELNCNLPHIKTKVCELGLAIKDDELIFFSKSLLEMNAERYKILSTDGKRLYDKCAMVFCLMVRKEFGQVTYLRLMKASSEESPEKAIQSILKFQNYDALDKAFKGYIQDLDRDVRSDKTPDRYLQITEKD